MFNFTTQTVYNIISTSGANKNMWVSANSKKPALRIGNTRFDAADVLDILMKNPTVENLASVTFDMDDILIDQSSTETEITARIALYIGLSMSSLDALYSNDLVYKGKPIYIEFSVKKNDTADVVAKRVKYVADKYLLLISGEKILDITATTDSTQGSETGTITITGVNGYLQIKKAVLQKFDPAAKQIDCCANQGEYIDVITGVPVIYTTNSTGVVSTSSNKVGADGSPEALAADETAIAPGIEAFGDYNWIIHNLRLPTAANTGFWAPTRGEMPVVGQQYVQFIVRLCKERDGISGSILGARAKTVTTHVLYVAQPYAATVRTELAKLGTVSTDADTKLQAPFV